MADNKPGGIQRQLEGGGNLYINKFWTGLYQNRSALYTPVSAMGVQLVARQDVLWAGHDIMISPQYSLRRRYGFLKSSTTALGSNEWPLDWFSFENLNGTIWQLVDTQSRVGIFSATALSTLAPKSTGAVQSSFQDVADTMYWCDGVDAYKFIGPNLLTQSNSITTTPWTHGDVTITSGQSDPEGGTSAFKLAWTATTVSAQVTQTVTPNYTPVASNTFTFSVWLKAAGTGTTVNIYINDQSGTIVQQTCTLTTAWQRFTLTGTMGSGSTEVIPVVADPSATTPNHFIYGAQLEVGAIATPLQITTTQPQGVYLWGIQPPTITPTLTYVANGSLVPLIGYSYVYCFQNAETGHISTASPASANTGPLGNQTVTEKHTVPASGPYTITVTNGATFLSDGGVVFDATKQAFVSVATSPTAGQYNPGVASVGTYTFPAANAGTVVDITYSYTLTASVGTNITVGGDGTADPQCTTIQIYRTKDGGALYYLVATVSNPGATTWTYTDSTADSGLNTFIIAPVAEVNAPPPVGSTLTTWFGGLLWLASGNTLYYSAGPNATNGVGEECWPPGNNFALPGAITALAATSSGLIIWTTDIAYVTQQLSNGQFTTPQPWQVNWGVANQNCVAQDGDNLFIFTTQGQVFNYGASGLVEIGSAEEQQFAAMTPSSVYMVVHRSGQDNGVFVSDGSANIYRYSQVSTSWDTPIQPVGGCGAIASIEMSNGIWKFLMGRPTGAGYILQRDLNTFTDDSQTYTASVTIGSLTIAPPRQVANLESVLMQLTGVGTYPTVSVMLNEIADSGTLPVTFVALPNPVPDPPQLAATQSIWTKRHDLKAAQSPLPSHVQHLQIKLAFVAEAQPNELLGFGLAHGKL